MLLHCILGVELNTREFDVKKYVIATQDNEPIYIYTTGQGRSPCRLQGKSIPVGANPARII